MYKKCTLLINILVKKPFRWGETKIAILSIISLSTGINMITSMAFQDKNGCYIYLILSAISFFISGIAFFILAAKIGNTYDEADRTYKYHTTDRTKYTIKMLAIKIALQEKNIVSNSIMISFSFGMFIIAVIMIIIRFI